jgi:tetratricopeptide (TPR) repeat protein
MSLLLDALKEAEYHKRGVNSPVGADSAVGADGSGMSGEQAASVPSPLSLQEDSPVARRSVAGAAAAPNMPFAQVSSLHAPRNPAPATGFSRLHGLMVALGMVVLLLGGTYFYLSRRIDAVPLALDNDALPESLAVPDTAVDAPGAHALPPAALESYEPPVTAPVRHDTLAHTTPDPPVSALSVKPIVIVGSSMALPLQAAYTALQAGDLARAQTLYEQVLAAEPGQPDSHLGLGVIAQSRQDSAAAIRHFRAVLVAMPDQPRAWAGLAELSGDGELAALESKLRGLLAKQPEGALYFALGNNLLRQSRWAEAQEQFFSAATAAPENAEYCFNLAVALDRIGKRDAAVAHYRKALQLAEGRPVQFDTASARSRLAALAPGIL